jgi:hypothetical protein
MHFSIDKVLRLDVSPWTVMDYDSEKDTTHHINRVRFLIGRCAVILLERGVQHDASKLTEAEKSFFDTVGDRFAHIIYNSEEYKRTLAELKPALDHHYAQNSHHPEHFVSGVNGMSLFDLIEMLMDWKASNERNLSGMGIAESIEISCERFKVGEQLKQILLNTAREIDWI